MAPEKQEVLWEKLVELKETPGKDGEAPEKRGEPSFFYINNYSLFTLIWDSRYGISDYN